MKLREITAPDGKRITFQQVPFPKIAQGIIFAATADLGNEYRVTLDSTRPRRDQRRSLGHELAHVFLGHFERPKGTDPEELEEEANRTAARFYVAYRLRLI